MKNTMVRILIAFMLMIIAAPAYSASALQVWTCALEAGKTGSDAAAVSTAWAKAANTMKGGEQMEVYLNFPLAAEKPGGSFSFVLIVPSIEEWGVFMGGYEGSAAQKADDAFEKVASCSGSSLWESIKME